KLREPVHVANRIFVPVCGSVHLLLDIDPAVLHPLLNRDLILHGHIGAGACRVGFHVHVHGNGQLERVFQNHLDAAVSGDGHGHGFVDGLGPIGAVNGNV
ncbi:30S ribosomal protein S6, partial [Dysosmobacter welbionis]